MAPDNAATAPGEQQAPKPGPPMHPCGEAGAYGKQKREGRVRPEGSKKNEFERDHVPSKKAITIAALKKAGTTTKYQKKCIKNRCRDRAQSIVIPASVHRNHSRTCGNKNKAIAPKDAKNLEAARDKDMEDVQAALDADPKQKKCADAYREACKEVKRHDIQKMIKQIIKDCKS